MSYLRVVIDEYGGPELLRLVAEASPLEPGPGQVRVRVMAAGTGFTDTAIRRGNYPDKNRHLPFTPGYDLVGEVEKLGPGVTGLTVGQWVADMSVIGGYSQYCVLPAANLVPIPKTLDPAEAACLPLAYMTAYQMLVRLRQFRPGDRVLIQGASGAVGTALVDLGHCMGLNMVGTCSLGKFDLVRRLGATPLDYRRADMIDEALRLSDGGFDGIFDAIGGHSHWARMMGCLRPGGWLIGYGAHYIARGEDSMASVLWGFAKVFLWWSWACRNGQRATFYHIQHRRRKKPDEFKEDLDRLAGMLARGEIHPVVAERRPLADARVVHEAIDAGRISGKVILLPWLDLDEFGTSSDSITVLNH